MRASFKPRLPEVQPAIRAFDRFRRERGATGRTLLLLAFGEGRSFLGEKLSRDGTVELSGRGSVLAPDVEPEELHVAEGVGALALGSVLDRGGIDPMSHAASLERPRQSADPRDRGYAHALELGRRRKRLELFLGGQRIGIDEVDVAVDAARGDRRVLRAARGAVPVVRLGRHGTTLARP